MSQSTEEDLVIIGAGQAGGELAVAVRQGGYAGRITLVGEEAFLPYQRPPLSKTYLAGAVARNSLFAKQEAAYAKAAVELRLGVRAVGIDRTAKSVALSDGGTLPYGRLVLACGGRPRPLVVEGLDGTRQPSNLHYLRTIDDVDRIRAQFRPGARLVIVGGGYIGLEVAAAARKHGLEVTLLEAMPRVLERVTAPMVSGFYERLHREAGVDLRTEAGVQRVLLDAVEDSVRTVICTDGSELSADLVVVGIGLIPNTELAAAAGLAVDNGIVVDEFTRSSDPDIFALGDCANHPNPIYGRRIRLESVPNALEQSRVTAAVLCGKPRAYASVPWFWSDQYDLKLQMAGLSQGHDEAVLRGSLETRSFIVFYLHEGRILAADAVNRPQEFMLSRRLIAERIPVDSRALADDGIPLKALLETAAAST